MSSRKFPSFDDVLLKSFAQRVDENRADLVSRQQQVLQETQFADHPELPLEELARIAAGEVDALVHSLCNSLSSAREHGMVLSEMGLSRQAIFGLLWALWEFLTVHFENDFAALNIYTSYQTLLLEGFLECYEKRLLSEHEKIGESEERYRALLELSPDMVVVVDLNGNVRMVNDAGVKLFRYETFGEVTGKNTLAFIAPDDHAMILDAFQKTLETGSASNVEFLAVRKDGTTFDASFTGSVIFDTNGNAQALMAVGRDITLQNQTEQMLKEKVAQATSELQKANKRLNELLTRSPAILYAGGLEGGCPITFISENVFEQLGYPAEQFTSDPDFVFNRVHPQDVERVRSETKHILENERMVMEYRVRHQNGEYRWVRDTVRVARSDEGLPLEFVGSWVDVTERKQEGESRRQAEEMLAEAQRISHLGSWTWDLTTDKIQFSDEMFRLVGMLPQDGAVTREVFAKYLPSTEAEQIFQQFLQSAAYPFSGFEHQIVLPGRETRDVYSRVKVYCDENGTPLRLLGSTQDITERKRMEDALKESEERYRRLVDTSPNAISLASLDGQLVFCNQQAAELYGYENVEAALGQNVFDFIAPEDRPRALENMSQTLIKGTVTNVEYTSLKRDGSRFPCELSASVLLDATGQPTALMGIIRDITERKQAEEMLRESEEAFRGYFNMGTVGMCVTSPEKGWLEVNDHLCNMLGYSREELTRMTWAEMTHPDDLVADVELFDQMLAGERNSYEMEKRFICKDGSVIHTLLYVTCQRNKNGSTHHVLASLVDITERKRIEQDLRIKDRALATTVNAIMITALDGKAIYVNDVLCSMFGYSHEEALQLNAVDLASDITEAHDVLRAVQSQGSFMGESIAKRKDGSPLPAQISASLITDSEDKPVAMMASFIDITERKQMEEALRNSHELFQSLFHSSPLSTILTRLPERIIVDVNAAFEELFGYTRAEMIGKSASNFDLWVDPARRQHTMDMLMKSGRVHDHEFKFRTKSGRIGYGVFRAETIEQREGKYTFAKILDITERKRMEEELDVSEKKFRALFEHASDGITLVDAAGNIIFESPSIVRITGHAVEERLNMNSFEVLHPDDRDTAQNVFGKLLQIPGGSETMEFRVLHKDGSYRHMDCTATNLLDEPAIQAVVINFRDNTERKQAEEKLRESEERFFTAFHANPVAQIITVLESSLILDVNEAFSDLMGYTYEELIGQTSKGLWMNFEDREGIVQQLQQGSGLRNMELQLVNRSGQLRHVLVSMTMMELKGEKCMISTLLDITERVQAETALSESEGRYRALAEAAHDMIFMIDRDDHITYVNSFASEQLERPPQALVGQPRSRWFGKPDSDRMLKHLRHVFEMGESHYAESEFAFSRGTVYLSTWLVPLKDESGVVTQALGVSRDITELKRLERSLKRTNLQLEARVEKRTAELRNSHNRLRELTQQIVTAQEEERRRISRELHDEAGQVLLGLRFSLDTVYRELPANSRKIRQRMVEALAQTDHTIQRIRELAYNLRPPTLDLLGVNLGIKELCREFSERAGLKVKYSGVDLEGLQDDISISIYRFVQEALTNVVKHAHASKVQVALEYQNEMIKATVQDNGRGIPDEKRYSGLGMVGIKERFDALGGQLEVTSITPKGTQVQVCLPWKCTTDVPHRPKG